MKRTVKLPAVDYFLFFHYNTRRISNSYGTCWQAENEADYLLQSCMMKERAFIT
jgi:hypothetical protein